MTVPDRSSAAGGLAALLLDQIECGIAACDADGRLLLANSAARREFDSARALAVAAGQLTCLGPGQSEFEVALADAVQRQLSRLLWAGEGAHRLMVAVMPVRGEPSHAPRALLMLGRRSLCSPLGLEMLAIRHGLTLAERRVLRALVDDHPARAIASDHGVALSTVRTQIQSIRHKVGVRNIDALLLRAAQVPPLSSSHEAR